MREFALHKRSCECCGGDNFEPVFEHSAVVVTAKNTWKFVNRTVVCKECGFCFQSPTPSVKDLEDYYKDGLSADENATLPYSADTRIELLKRYSVPNGVFAEVGGYESGEFHRRCAPLFGNKITVQISADANTDLKSIYELQENSIDVLAHYDVLEHVSNIKEFLAACYAALRLDGVMICEIPDMRLYPKNLVLLEFSHVNHFSITTLNSIAKQIDFDLIEVGHNCSRQDGLLAVFRKAASYSLQIHDGRSEYLDALACAKGGVEQVNELNRNISAIKKKITQLASDGRKITVWAVNNFSRKLLQDFDLPNIAIVVDMDPRRRNHFIREGVSVGLPSEFVAHISQSELLVICAPQYSTEILQWIASNTNKSFLGEVIEVGRFREPIP
jgi:hypothetical protein